MKQKYIPLVFVTAIIFVGLMWLFQKSRTPDTKYIAVFLNNNQVYFGQQLFSFNSFLTLKNVYYLKANMTDTASPSAQLTLVKLGEELHAPTDEIKINRSQIIFIEEMKSKGTIMDAIWADKNKTK